MLRRNDAKFIQFYLLTVLIHFTDMKTPDHESMSSQQATGTTTPPPFRPNEESQEQATTSTIEERIAELALDETATRQLTSLTAGMNADDITTDLLTTLARGIKYDDDVQNADAAGYLRGRNEKIETVLHPQPDDEDTQTSPVFPRYCRRSIWD